MTPTTFALSPQLGGSPRRTSHPNTWKGGTSLVYPLSVNFPTPPTPEPVPEIAEVQELNLDLSRLDLPRKLLYEDLAKCRKRIAELEETVRSLSQPQALA
ncbi:MAG: hypothetical protein WC822_05940 [Candidatus Paceibacterota bacterium]